MTRTCLSIVLAAGEGTRMASAKAKVLHEVAGLPLVCHAAQTAVSAGSTRVAIVVGRSAETVAAAVRHVAPGVSAHVQSERRGTAHAVLAAKDAIAEAFDDVLVLFGDTPLVRGDTLLRARAQIADGAAICVVGFRTDAPTGYGRLIESDGALVAIREEKDASEAERGIRFCNGGVMAIAGDVALALLSKVGNANAKGEFYLTDIVAIAQEAGLGVRAIEAGADEVLGVNTRVELAAVERLWQDRRRREMMLAGVTLIAPETVFFAYDTQVAADVVIEPNVVFGRGVEVGAGSVVHAFSHIDRARVGEGVSVGPFARLREGTDLRAGARVGNFCEVKNAEIGEGAKVNHLTYIGDAFVGAGTNIGAGTITCNYDGALKHHTHIGANAFIGSNSALVAPVRVGDGAYIASGSVITDDVPDGALAIARQRQVTKEDRGRQIAERNRAAKSAKAIKPSGSN